ncbi:hypothetical protein HYV12_00735 [Candidatus Dojkabacteria bacterium]|nr:hypothetical protein [Candidatus Dojkabacteria bacterium]
MASQGIDPSVLHDASFDVEKGLGDKYRVYNELDAIFLSIDEMSDSAALEGIFRLPVLEEVEPTTVILKDNEVYLGGLALSYILPTLMDGKSLSQNSSPHARLMNTVILRIAKVLDKNGRHNIIQTANYSSKDSAGVSINDMFNGVDPNGDYNGLGVSISSLHLAAKLVYDHHDFISKRVDFK